jgi:hypothetical protein
MDHGPEQLSQMQNGFQLKKEQLRKVFGITVVLVNLKANNEK